MSEADASRTSRRAALAGGGLSLAALAALAALAGCGPPGEPGASGSAAGTAPGGPAARRLRIGTSFVVSNMVPGDNPQWHSTYGVAQTLYRILPEDRLAPWIASVTEVPEGGDPSALVGKGFYSGPFRATALSADRLTLDAVPDAWDGAPKLAGVDITFIRDPLARFNALKTGEIDLMLYTASDALPQIKATPGLHFKATPTAELVWVQLNHRRPPFDEVAVRRALAAGIDRKPIAESVLNGAYDAFDSVYPPTLPWAVRGVIAYDQGAARKLLEDAGWRPGPDGIRVKDGKRLSFEWLHYPQQPDSKPMGEAMQAQLKAVGFDVRLKQVDDISGVFRSREYDAGIRYNSMQKTGNPMSILNTNFRTDSPGNEGGWGSAELDGLIRRLNVEFDERARSDQLKQVQEHFRRDVPITFGVSKRWSATVVDAYSDYVASHDNHAYVVTKDTAPAPARSR